MNNKRNLVGILATSAILAGCNSTQKNDNLLVGNYRFEREAIEYVDSFYKGENEKPAFEEYIKLAGNADDNKDLYISKEEVDGYFSEITAIRAGTAHRR